MKNSISMEKGIVLILCMAFSCIGIAQNVSDSLTIELENHFSSSSLPGLSVSVTNENKVLYQNSFGYSNRTDGSKFKPTTIQNIGSVSKTVVGLALVKAIEDGELTLDTEINDILPFDVVNPHFKDNPILIRHLANHTSSILDTKHYGKTYVLDNHNFTQNDNVHQDFLGFVRGHEELSMKEFLANILNNKGKWYRKKNFLKKEPGSTKEYSNINAALAALIIEMATGVPFSDYTKMKIFEPLFMSSTSWGYLKENEDMIATQYFPSGKEVPRYKLITYPDGGLYSNVLDLSKYLIEMTKAFSGSSDYLSLEHARLLFPGDNDINRAFWGLRIRNQTIGHEGSDPGAQADLRFKIESKIGRIILMNTNAEDNDELNQQYQAINDILDRYERRLAKKQPE